MPLVSPTFAVTVHPYISRIQGGVAYELGKTTAKNAIIFVGGLFDGPHTVLYTRMLAKFIGETSGLDYSLFEFRMRSSFIGFGTSSLTNDVEDISALVKYLRSIGREKIVLFGHSTGCQDCMEYSDYKRHRNLPVDAFILQAPVSDREMLKTHFANFDELLALSEKMVANGEENELMPAKMIPDDFDVPITAYRMRSLAAKGGDDDYFSSDLDQATRARFWGRFKKPVMIMNSEEDEYVPVHVNPHALLQSYMELNPLISQLSGYIPDANHAVTAPDAQRWMTDSVVSFLKTLE